MSERRVRREHGGGAPKQRAGVGVRTCHTHALCQQKEKADFSFSCLLWFFRLQILSVADERE